jgi:hypothetical protein
MPSTAIYARVSTTDQNCESQLKELREFVQRRGWEIAGEYVDTGFSGAKASRPALDRLMSDAAKHKFDCVAVYKIDRFGRSVLHLNQQLATLGSYGVRFNRLEGLDSSVSKPCEMAMTPLRLREKSATEKSGEENSNGILRLSALEPTILRVINLCGNVPPVKDSRHRGHRQAVP